ncbi:MAG: AAA family ATPase [Clostridiales bacterium]|nr:AAA family ATPase [Clostridiales bacterium]
MKIDKLKINSYGRIENKDIELKQGINIIKGYNEAGKSTLLSFINSILYGIDKKKQNSYISEFDRYMPWISDDFSGSVKYTLDNNLKYEVFRNFKKKNPVIYDENKNDISKLFKSTKNGIDFLEEQTGIDKVTFQNSGISYQKLVVLDEKEKSQMVQKMTNLVSTGEENISYNNLLKKLSNRQIEEIGTSRTKKRPINDIEEALLKLEQEKQEIYNTREKKNKIILDRKEVQNEFSEIDIKREFINEVKEYYLEAGVNKDSNVNIYSEIKQKQDRIFDLKQEKIDTITKESPFEKSKGRNGIFTGIFIILGVILGILTLIHYGVIEGYKEQFDILTYKGTSYYLHAGLLLILIYLLVVTFSYLFSKNKIDKEMAEAEENNRLIEKEVFGLRKEIMVLEKEMEKEQEVIADSNKVYVENIKIKYKEKLSDKYITEVLNKKPGELAIESKKIENKYQNIIFKLSAIDAEKNIMEKTVFKLSEITEKIEKLQEEKEELLNYNKAFDIAKELLIKSYDELKDNIGPMFNDRLSYIASKITENKYNDISINRSNEIKVRNESGELVDLELLSTGTIEQINLALRIAMLETVSKEKLPLILDEAFAFYDDKRLENVLYFLLEEYKERQVIIFTCSQREIDILQDKDVNYIYL